MNGETYPDYGRVGNLLRRIWRSEEGQAVIIALAILTAGGFLIYWLSTRIN